jgi:hypothetical protein
MDPRRWHTFAAELDPDQVRPGVLGLVVVLSLVVATALLLRSFTKQLRRIDVPDSRPGPEPKDPNRPAPPA